MDELTAARRIVGELAGIADRLTRSDRRFLESWTAYLARTGDGAKIGPNRLEYLRRTHADYFPEAPGVAPLAVAATVRG